MHIKDYFDFVSEDEVRVRGTRIGIEAILSEYRAGVLPEEISLNYPPLTLEQVHATITYYLGHKTVVDEYLSHWAARSEAKLEFQRAAGSPLLDRLKSTSRSGTGA